MNKILTKEEFTNQIKKYPIKNITSIDYLYDVYEYAFEGVKLHYKQQNLTNRLVDSFELISYLLGEYLYTVAPLKEEDRAKLEQNEQVQVSMAAVVADKYISLSLYNHRENKLTNTYLPPISSINLYFNLMLNIVTHYEKNDPKNTLIIDLLTKSLSIARSVINLLVEGYETEAFAIWRTLHECECTLILLDKYGDVAINAYLKHMKYGIAYKGGMMSIEEAETTIAQVKEEMAGYGLKSKDMKKYIEYGWLNAVNDIDPVEGFKLNFRDGLESLAGLHQYAELYMTSSEILHSTPLLIYSNKQYFYFVTLINVYESFFRIEKVFMSLFFSRVGDNLKNQYLEMKKLYYSQLINIHKRESLNFKLFASKK